MPRKFILLPILNQSITLKEALSMEEGATEQMMEHLPAANHCNFGGVTMADHKIAQIEHLSQRLSHKLKRINDLISEAWLEHELARESLRQLFNAY